MYKTDNLFGSIRVSDGNLSVTKGFHLFNCSCTDILDQRHLIIVVDRKSSLFLCLCPLLI